MPQRFRGSDTYKVDSKGRVSIPAQFRRVLEASDPDWTEGLNPNLVIVYGDEEQTFLDCYSIEAMREIDAKISAMQRFSPKREYFEEHFYGNALPTQVDETGRLLLPTKLRNKIALKDAAYFHAKGDTFQIWNPAEFEAVAKPRRDTFRASLPQGVNPLALLDDEGV
ncbi:MAG: division/cell wall cluster transcriptional repressor MraZ [Pseudomonadota bacterium]